MKQLNLYKPFFSIIVLFLIGLIEVLPNNKNDIKIISFEQFDSISNIKKKKNKFFMDSRDGNIYKVVKIGSQIWMAENLKYLPKIVDAKIGSISKPLYYVYDYSDTIVKNAKLTSNYSTYGVLYNWSAVMNGEKSSDSNHRNVQGICPKGWHLPSDAEWNQLFEYIDNLKDDSIKNRDTIQFISINNSNIYTVGFAPVLGGRRYYDGTFQYIENLGFWWSSTTDEKLYAWYRSIGYDYNELYRSYSIKEDAFSVRCIKN